MNTWIDRVINHHKGILVCLILFTIPFGYFYSRQAFHNHISMFFDKEDPDLVYYEQFQKQFGNDEVAAIVFKSDDIFTRENISVIRGISNAAKAIDGVQRVMSLTEAEIAEGDSDGESVSFEKLIPEDMELTAENLANVRHKSISHHVIEGNLISKDGRTTAIMIELAPIDSNEAKKVVLDTIRNKAERIARHKVSLHYSGGPYLESEIERLTRADNYKFTPITFFLIIGIVYFMLRNLTLTLLGQLNIIFILLWGIGFLIMCGETINTVTVIIAPILLAISIADSIHILSFFRESYRNNGFHYKEAVAESIRRLWFPCLFTSLTTAVGYLSFVTTNVRPVKTVGIYTAIGVMVAFFLTLVLLPSMLVVLEKWIGKHIRTSSNRRRHQHEDRFLTALVKMGHGVVSHYKGVALVFLLITLVTSLGMLKLRFETDFVSYLKDKNIIKKDIKFIEKNIRGTVPVELVLKATSKRWDFSHPESLKLLERIQKDVMAHMDGRFTTSFSVADYIKEINAAFNKGDPQFYSLPKNHYDVLDYFELGDGEILDHIISPDRMETRLSFASCFGSSEKSKKFTRYVESHVKPLLGHRYDCKATGLSALYITMDKNLRISQLRSFGSAFVVIFIMMFFVCKNLKLTLISIVPNLFPIFVTLGIMGWFNIPLDASTIMIASVTIGIAVDDTIHFITWFRRNRLAGLDTAAAVRKAFHDTGKPIVMTSVVLCISYLVLITGSVKPTIAFGALAGLAMFFALLGDLFILPALILIFKPKIKLEESYETATGGAVMEPRLEVQAHK